MMQKTGSFQKLKNRLDEAQYRADIRAFESFSLELDAGLSLWITGCREIKEYTEEYILLDCGKTAVRITGQGLTIRVFSPAQTAVDGKIEDITLL